METGVGSSWSQPTTHPEANVTSTDDPEHGGLLPCLSCEVCTEGDYLRVRRRRRGRHGGGAATNREVVTVTVAGLGADGVVFVVGGIVAESRGVCAAEVAARAKSAVRHGRRERQDCSDGGEGGLHVDGGGPGGGAAACEGPKGVWTWACVLRSVGGEFDSI